jgi:hypothetical protein
MVMMVNTLRMATLCLAALALVVGAIGCGSSTTDGNQEQEFVAPSLDMVAVSPREDRLLIFRDVARKSFGSVAEVLLDEGTSNIDRPSGVFVAENRLFVTSQDDGNVQIFNDFAGLMTGATADVVLTGLDRPNRIFVNGTSLYIATRSNVVIYRDIPTLVTGDPADVVISDGVDNAKDVVVGGDVLYVANLDDNSVTCYNGAESLTGNTAPDVTLDNTTSLIGEPQRLTYHAGTLYVGARYYAVYVFRNIAAAVDGQAPNVVLGGPSNLDGVRRPLVDDYRMYIPNRWGDFDDDEPGLHIYNDVNALTNGQLADVELITENAQRVHASDLHSNVLVGYNDDLSTFFVYLQANEIEAGQEPDIVLWDPRYLQKNRVAEVFLVTR